MVVILRAYKQNLLYRIPHTNVTQALARQITRQITRHITCRITRHITRDITRHITRQITGHITRYITRQITRQIIAPAGFWPRGGTLEVSLDTNIAIFFEIFRSF